jgi:CxxC motif-containing protein (DUF1111 family)
MNPFLIGIASIYAGGVCLLAQEENIIHPPESYSGGETTVHDAGEASFGLALANARPETRRKFIVGKSFFDENWIVAPASAAARDGLGPLFHARSCFDCHPNDGRGAPPDAGDTMTSLLLRTSVAGNDAHGGPKPHPIYGQQLAVRAIPPARPEVEIAVSWEELPGQFPDGTPYQLRRPHFKPTAWHYGEPQETLQVSPRLGQAVFGLGLLEAIREQDLRALEDPEDANGDGISGRLNLVWDSEQKITRVGRFGWKANVADLRQQTAIAFLGDIGIRSPVLPEGDYTEAQAPALASFPVGGSPEISETLLSRVVTYLRALAPPGRRDTDHPTVKRGEAIFRQIQCAVCHQETFTTGSSPELKELEHQLIRPYTNLLLHDMGEGLADHRPDYLANGREWRTPPLWGLGLHEEVNGNVFLLHDGRARSVTEAILWHDGEAAQSKEQFRNLSKSERAALLQFLESL